MADGDLAAERHDGAAGVELALRQREVRVRQDDPEQQHGVGVLDQLGNGGIAGGAHIGAGQHVAGLLQQATAHEGGHHRHAERARELGDLPLDAVAADFDVDDHHRLTRRGEAIENLVGTFGKRGAVGGAARQYRHRAGLGIDQIARELDIDRQRLLQRAAQHAGDLRRRRRRIVEHGLVAGDLAVDGKLGVDGARLVVQQEAGGPLLRARRASDHHHRRALRVSAGDRVDQVEGAGAIGDDGDAEALVVARGGIGREADRRLVAERVARQDFRFLDDLVERQHEIAGDAEDLPGAVVLQALQKRGGKRGHGERS